MVGILWTSDQFVAQAATCTVHNKHESGIKTRDPSNQKAKNLRL